MEMYYSMRSDLCKEYDALYRKQQNNITANEKDLWRENTFGKVIAKIMFQNSTSWC